MPLVYRLRDEIRQWLIPLQAWQALGLAIFSYGVVKGRHSQLSLLAEDLSEFGEVETVRKRLNRWLSNPRIDTRAVCQAWVSWVWAAMPAQQRAILIVDETKIGKRIGVLMISLAYQKRAIPLMWRCYKADSAADYPPEGQVQMIVAMMQQICACLPAASRPILLADRGIGHSSTLMKKLQKQQIRYLLRIKWEARFTDETGDTAVLHERAQPGLPWKAEGTLFTHQRQVASQVHIRWDVDCPQPWCLATNDPTISSLAYAQRVWQEESFRDLKSGGWQWQSSFIRDPDRASRFLLILAVAYGWMVALGARLIEPSTEKPRYSIFRRGLQWATVRLNRLEADLIPVRLDFRLARL